MQGFMNIAEIPADGYSIELGKIEIGKQRGQIIATGQIVKGVFSLLAGVIQTLFLNSPKTNPSNCESCWDWGLNVNGYYGLLFLIVIILVVPVLWLQELKCNIPAYTFKSHLLNIWDTLQSLTRLNMVIYSIGIGAFTHMPLIVSVYMQHYIIGLTSFQAGIDAITTSAFGVLACWIFKEYLINKNWRVTEYCSTIICSLLGLLWLLPYFDVGGTRNPWFTIFINLDQSFVIVLGRVVTPMVVIELTKAGQEATTYMIIHTICHASNSLAYMFATQLLSPLHTRGCTQSGECLRDEIDITSDIAFDSTKGPYRFTVYTVVLISISIVTCLIFTRFLPKSKLQCEEWKKKGELVGSSTLRCLFKY
jgi:hypothetical protein